jgi:hypothetical protein
MGEDKGLVEGGDEGTGWVVGGWVTEVVGIRLKPFR